MAAAAFIGRPAAMVTPHRITQVQIARIGRGANHSTTNRTGGRAKRGITGSSADSRTTGGAKQGTTGRAVTRIGAATRDEQRRRKTQHHCRAHIWLPLL